jgi:hypothetical protein
VTIEGTVFMPGFVTESLKQFARVEGLREIQAGKEILS